MDFIFICRDGLENSFLSNLVLAVEARKAGSEVAVLFTQEALAVLGGESFDWSPLLRDRDTRIKVSLNAKKAGIPLASPKDPRWTEPRQLLKWAREAGVRLLACPTWTSFLELKGKLPAEVEEIDLAGAVSALKQAKTVIGSF